MKLSVAGCQLSVILLSLFFSFTDSYAQPESIKPTPEEAVAAPYIWDFGKVKAGKLLKHDFVLKNDSGKILNIKSVDTSCGCAVSQVKKKKLLPQESTIVEVKFNTKGYSGAVKKFVYVHTDSIDNPLTRYIIKADVER